MMTILGMDNLHDEVIDAKSLLGEQLVYQNKSVDIKWVKDTIGKQKTESLKVFKNLLLLVSKILNTLGQMPLLRGYLA